MKMQLDQSLKAAVFGNMDRQPSQTGDEPAPPSPARHRRLGQDQQELEAALEEQLQRHRQLALEQRRELDRLARGEASADVSFLDETTTSTTVRETLHAHSERWSALVQDEVEKRMRLAVERFQCEVGLVYHVSKTLQSLTETAGNCR